MTLTQLVSSVGSTADDDYKDIAVLEERVIANSKFAKYFKGQDADSCPKEFSQIVDHILWCERKGLSKAWFQTS